MKKRTGDEERGAVDWGKRRTIYRRRLVEEENPRNVSRSRRLISATRLPKPVARVWQMGWAGLNSYEFEFRSPTHIGPLF